MLRIGEFAWLGNVTVETLRHYDRIGLFAPAEVDTFTGHRMYTLEQLPRIHRILVLEDSGLALDVIGRMLEGDLSPEEIREMLEEKQTELELHLTEATDKLKRVEARLKLIASEGFMPDHEVSVKTVVATQIASVREALPTWHVAPDFGRMYDTVI